MSVNCDDASLLLPRQSKGKNLRHNLFTALIGALQLFCGTDHISEIWLTPLACTEPPGKQSAETCLECDIWHIYEKEHARILQLLQQN